MKPETKFWQDVRKIKSEIRWTRLENLSSLGTPDLLGYNNNGVFFTVELKVTKSNKITISPHQIAFHIIYPGKGPLVQGGKTLWRLKDPGPCCLWLEAGAVQLGPWIIIKKISKLVAWSLWLIAMRQYVAAWGLWLEACGLSSCDNLPQLVAWSLWLFVLRHFALRHFVAPFGCASCPASFCRSFSSWSLIQASCIFFLLELTCL